MNDSTLLMTIGVAYATAFLLIGYRWPGIALMLVIAGAPFQNDLSGASAYASASGKFSIAELNLALTATLFILKWLTHERRWIAGPVVIASCAYLIVCALASAPRWEGMTTTVTFLQMVLYLGVAVVVFASLPGDDRDCIRPWYAYFAVCAVLATVAAASRQSYVLGLHKNGLGDSLAAAVVIGAELWMSASSPRVRRWLIAGLAVIGGGLIVSLSRGAWVGAIVGMLVICVMRRRLTLLLRLGIAILPVALICWNLLPKEDVETATDFSANRYNIRARYMSIDIARAYFLQSPILGNGITLRKQYDATNVFWFTLAETGVLGVMAFGAVHLTVAYVAMSAARTTDPGSPGFSFLVLAAALVALKLTHGLVDHYWTRGSIMCAWAAVGMATRVYVLRVQHRLMPQVVSQTEAPVSERRRRFARSVNKPSTEGPSSLDISW